MQWSCHVIWAGLGPTSMAAQKAGLKTQECQCNLSAIYIGRNQNGINNIAWVKVGPCFNYSMLKLIVIKKTFHMAMWQNRCFGQFYHSQIEVLQNCLVFLSVSLLRGNLKELRGFFFQKNLASHKFMEEILNW